MATEHVFWTNGITTNKAIGDFLGLLLDPDPNATETFITKLRPIGSNATEPTAWFTGVALKANAHAAVVEFDGAGPYPTFNAMGVTNQQVATGKAALVLEYGPRAQYEGRALAFIAEQGYEIIPPEAP